ncbi:MAG: hypothetical protein KDA90_18055 [Planctomycetaceae bacterium]|nr:hypothetical protein [Planctomycetaceae bacterium]
MMEHDIPFDEDDDDYMDEVAAAEAFGIEPEDEYEEIDSDEVDRVVTALESLIDSTSSENIRAYLDEAAQNIYRLVYEEENAWEDESEGPAAEAA